MPLGVFRGVEIRLEDGLLRLEVVLALLELAASVAEPAFQLARPLLAALEALALLDQRRVGPDARLQLLEPAEAVGEVDRLLLAAATATAPPGSGRTACTRDDGARGIPHLRPSRSRSHASGMPGARGRPTQTVRSLAATHGRRLRMSKDLVRIKLRNFPQAQLGRRLLLAGTK